MVPENVTERVHHNPMTFWIISKDTSWSNRIEEVASQLGTVVNVSHVALETYEAEIKNGDIASPDIYLINAHGLDNEALTTMVRRFQGRTPRVLGIIFAADLNLKSTIAILTANCECDYQRTTYAPQITRQNLTNAFTTLEEIRNRQKR
ncbi:MAG: hypothetical protein ACOX50_02210 [Patescibacteria group bacterium]|jgi:hypothetical protein